jgi:DNA primase
MISKRTLEEIRFRSDIVDVIGGSLPLKRAGSAFKALCPFHKEKTPSFHVNQQRQIFHCFGCGAGGDVFRFLMQYEGVDFMTAVRMLAQRAGIQVEAEEGGADAGDKLALYKLHSDLAAFYHRTLKAHSSAERARAYLAERDLDEETVRAFEIGYAPPGWDTTVLWAEKNKVPRAILETAGIVVSRETQDARGDVYDRFRDRLMFPIRDEQGRVIAFSGRILDKDRKEAKYVNSPETPLFQKGRVLYAIEKARRSIVDSREAIVCEGQIDVIRCHQAGFTNAVAAQGTAFTEDHVRTIRRYADSVVLVYDGDKAGQDAAVRTAATFLSAGLAVRVAALPAGDDPDSFIRKRGPEAFRDVVGHAMSAVSFQIQVLSQRENADSEIGVMRIAKAVLATIAQTPNETQRAKMLQEAAQRLRLPVAALERDFRHQASGHRFAAARSPAPEGETKRLAQHPAEEVMLCEHLVRVADHPGMAALVEEFLPLDMIRDTACRAIVQAALEQQRTGTPIAACLQNIDDAGGELQRLAAAVQMAPERIMGRESTHEDAVRSLILRIWRRDLEGERQRIADELRDSPEARLQQQRMQLTLDIKTLSGGHWVEGSLRIRIRMAERGTTPTRDLGKPSEVDQTQSPAGQTPEPT